MPDETTHCRFRNALVRGGVYDDLLSEVCRQIEACGLKLKEAEAAIIDATLIEKDNKMSRTMLHFSADPDARWVKKGFWVTRALPAPTFVTKVHTTPANKGESPEFATMIDGAKAQRVLADVMLQKIMRKAVRERPLSEKRFKLISKRRFRVEQCFGTMKRLLAFIVHDILDWPKHTPNWQWRDGQGREQIKINPTQAIA